jgi:hypothetical protein
VVIMISSWLIIRPSKGHPAICRPAPLQLVWELLAQLPECGKPAVHWSAPLRRLSEPGRHRRRSTHPAGIGRSIAAARLSGSVRAPWQSSDRSLAGSIAATLTSCRSSPGPWSSGRPSAGSIAASRSTSPARATRMLIRSSIGRLHCSEPLVVLTRAAYEVIRPAGGRRHEAAQTRGAGRDLIGPTIGRLHCGALTRDAAGVDWKVIRPPSSRLHSGSWRIIPATLLGASSGQYRPAPLQRVRQGIRGNLRCESSSGCPSARLHCGDHFRDPACPAAVRSSSRPAAGSIAART